MDPKNVQLTTTQKIVPLLKAINKEIPWQIVLVIAISLTTAVVGTAAIPVFITSPFWDFILRRFAIGAVIAFVSFLVCGFTMMTIEDKLLPLIGKIKEHYEKESLAQKKKVLEDAEVEMLKK